LSFRLRIARLGGGGQGEDGGGIEHGKTQDTMRAVLMWNEESSCGEKVPRLRADPESLSETVCDVWSQIMFTTTGATDWRKRRRNWPV